MQRQQEVEQDLDIPIPQTCSTRGTVTPVDLKLFEVEQDLGKSIPQIHSTQGTVIVPGCHVKGQQKRWL